MSNKHQNPTWPSPPSAEEPDPTQAEPDIAEVDVEAVGVGDDIARITAERDDYLDQLQRSRAEFVNYRRRNDQERAQLRQFVARDVISQFLPVLDDFDRALTVAPADEANASFVKGVEMIHTKLNGIVDRLGVTRVEALGQPFDPALHEAVATEPGTNGGTVVEVYQNGYRIGDILVRPAMVKTGDPPPADDSDIESNDDHAFDA